MNTNDKLRILGTGHSESITQFNCSGIVLGSSGNLLIDCGYTIKRALAASELGIDDVDAIYVSHVHGDHVFGLERFAYETRYKYQKRIDLIFHESLYDELWHQTLAGSLGRNSEGPAYLEDYFEVHALSGDTFSRFGHDYRLIAADHTPGKPAFGLMIDDHLYFSTDTLAMPDIVPSLGFSVGFHDATLQDWNPVHATIDSLIESYPAAVRKKLYLMSYEDNWREHSERVTREFAGFAKQGMEIDLSQ